MNPNAAQNNGWKIATLGLGVVLVVVLLIAAWGMFGSDDGDQEAEPSKSPLKPSSSTSSAPPTTDTASADGCLGGDDPQTAVLAAQREAPLTAKGAAEFAASATRWMGYAPRSDKAHDQKVLKKVTTGPIRKTFDRQGFIAKEPKGAIRGWTESKDSHYRIVSSSPKRVVLDIWLVSNVQAESLETRTASTGGRYELRANDQGQWIWWEIKDENGDWDDVPEDGYRGTQEFVGGC